MAGLEREIYIPKDNKNLVHLKLKTPGQKSEDYNFERDSGRIYSLFDLISLGKGKMQVGLDMAFDVIEKERENVFSDIPAYAPELERNLFLNEDGEYVVTVSQIIKSKNSVQEVFSEGDVYTEEELWAAGEGNLIEGINRIHEYFERRITQDEEEDIDALNENYEEADKNLADINLARPRINPEDNRPLSEEIALFSAPKEVFITH